MDNSINGQPVLLYDGGCAVCEHIADWVRRSATTTSGGTRLIVKAIGDDPEALAVVAPGLDIWDAYKTNYLVMPNGPMKQGGEAVAEVFRLLPLTSWFAGVFDVHVFGQRPAQAVLNVAYTILSDVRPLLGCGSCGAAKPWVKPLERMLQRGRRLIGVAPQPRRPMHASVVPGRR